MEEKVEFYKEKEFKDTEIGRIPKEWEVVELGKISNILMGQSPPGKTYNNDGKGIPFLQGKAEFGPFYPRHIKFTTSPLKIAESGSILISVRAPVGDVNIANINYCIGRGLASISVRKGSNIFLFYLLKYFKQNIEKEGTGSTFKAINKNKLENVKIPWPSLEEQQKIAEILLTIDETIQKTDEIIDKTESLKKGLMQELFTKGIGHKEFKETEIGKIPKDWEIKRLKDIVIKAKMGGTPRRNISEYWNGNIPFVKIEDITMSGKYLYNTEEFITEKGLENSSVWIVPKDSLLLAIYGSLGSIGINKIDVATNQAIVGIIPNNDILGIEFLYYYYLYFKPYWYKFIKKSTQPNLTLGIILDSLVPIPPLEEQKKIAEILSTLDKKLEVLKQEKVKLEKIKQWFMDELLTGKIRVRVS